MPPMQWGQLELSRRVGTRRSNAEPFHHDFLTEPLRRKIEPWRIRVANHTTIDGGGWPLSWRSKARRPRRPCSRDRSATCSAVMRRPRSDAWAIAIGGGGAHGIGSELEFSETRNFFETPDGVAHGEDHHADAQHLRGGADRQAAPLRHFRVRLHPAAHRDRRPAEYFPISRTTTSGTASAGASRSSSPRHAGVRGDLRHFKVRKSDGISFQRLTDRDRAGRVVKTLPATGYFTM